MMKTQGVSLAFLHYLTNTHPNLTNTKNPIHTFDIIRNLPSK